MPGEKSALIIGQVVCLIEGENLWGLSDLIHVRITSPPHESELSIDSQRV
jgi:hypothetical protein